MGKFDFNSPFANLQPPTAGQLRAQRTLEAAARLMSPGTASTTHQPQYHSHYQGSSQARSSIEAELASYMQEIKQKGPRSFSSRELIEEYGQRANNISAMG